MALEHRADIADRDTVVPATNSPRPKSSKDVPHVQEHGVTVLWQPDAGVEVIADIFFVHGLAGHPRKTWQSGKAEEASKQVQSGDAARKPAWNPFKKEASRKSTEDKTIAAARSSKVNADASEWSRTQHCFWPYDLVPNDFGNVRIMTYGYDSHPSHFYTGRTVQMSITQHSQQLLQSITNFRQECRGRPVIFVAHSLGGILVKDAITVSGKYEHQPALKDLSLSCKAIIFFGTPHHGANAAAYGEMIANLVGALPLSPSVNTGVLRGLKPDGEKLSIVTADFNDILNKDIPPSDKIQIYSFREGKPLTNVRTLDGKVVSDTSAFFNRRDIEGTSMIMANHMDMCKFDGAQNPGYVDFRAALRDYLRRIQDRHTTQRREAQERDVEELAKAVDFGERIQRQQHIAQLLTSSATFEWIWVSPFAKWLVNEEPLFWISGKPASGKSTLMYHIMNSDTTSKLLRQAFGEQVIFIYYFFDFRSAGGLGNNLAGFVRSLFLQLLKKNPTLNDRAKRLASRHRDSRQVGSSDRIDFELTELSEVLLETLHAVPGHVFVAIDGLDEYAGEPLELVQFIKRIARPKTKVCLASRPDPPFPDTFQEAPSFKMHELNAPGIFTYAQQVFENACLQRYWSSPVKTQQLAEEIVSQSRGVFLWARFAALDIVERLAKGDLSSDMDLIAAIRAVPSDLESIYSRIIQRASLGDRALARVVLTYVTYALEPIKLAMLKSLLQLHHGDDSPWFREVTYVDPSPKDMIFFERKILASCGGLVELYSDSEDNSNSEDKNAERASAKLGLLHRTVKTHLENSGWSDFSATLSKPGREQDLWLQSCLASIHRHADTVGSRFPTRHGSQPNTSFGVQLLMEYTYRYMPEHAKVFEDRTGVSSYDILRDVLTDSYNTQHGIQSERHLTVCSCYGVPTLGTRGDLRVAVSHELDEYIRTYLAQENDEPAHSSSASQRRSPLTRLTSRFPAMIGFRKRQLDETDPLRHYVVNFAIFDSRPSRINILRIALQRCPYVADAELLNAFRLARLDVIRCLLDTRPSGQLLFNVQTSWATEGRRFIGQAQLLEGVVSRNIVLRPFWAVGQRLRDNTAELIDLLVSRGENINEECGPFGTVLHSHFENWAASHGYSGESFHLLVEKGADVNARGRYGTVLEFVWMLANTREIKALNIAFSFQAMIDNLIGAGAVNNRADPNGLVPSVERMKNFARTGDEYAESIRFYKKGPRKRGEPAARWRHEDDHEREIDPGYRSPDSSQREVGAESGPEESYEDRNVEDSDGALDEASVENE